MFNNLLQPNLLLAKISAGTNFPQIFMSQKLKIKNVSFQGPFASTKSHCLKRKMFQLSLYDRI